MKLLNDIVNIAFCILLFAGSLILFGVGDIAFPAHFAFNESVLHTPASYVVASFLGLIAFALLLTVIQPERLIKVKRALIFSVVVAFFMSMAFAKEFI